MAKNKSGSKDGDSKYQQKLRKRMRLAKQFGASGYYTSDSQQNKGKRYPLPLPILKSMIGG